MTEEHNELEEIAKSLEEEKEQSGAMFKQKADKYRLRAQELENAIDDLDVHAVYDILTDWVCIPSVEYHQAMCVMDSHRRVI